MLSVGRRAKVIDPLDEVMVALIQVVLSAFSAKTSDSPPRLIAETLD